MIQYDKFRSDLLRDFVAKNTDVNIMLPDESHIQNEYSRATEYENVPQRIKELVADTRETWQEAPPETTHWWCFNHGRLIAGIDLGYNSEKYTPEQRKEKMLHIVNERIRQIVFNKHSSQREVRLRNFRPVKPGTVTPEDEPAKVLAAYKEQVGTDDWIPQGDSAVYGTLKGTN